MTTTIRYAKVRVQCRDDTAKSSRKKWDSVPISYDLALECTVQGIRFRGEVEEITKMLCAMQDDNGEIKWEKMDVVVVLPNVLYLESKSIEKTFFLLRIDFENEVNGERLRHLFARTLERELDKNHNTLAPDLVLVYLPNHPMRHAEDDVDSFERIFRLGSLSRNLVIQSSKSKKNHLESSWRELWKPATYRQIRSALDVELGQELCEENKKIVSRLLERRFKLDSALLQTISVKKKKKQDTNDDNILSFERTGTLEACVDVVIERAHIVAPNLFLRGGNTTKTFLLEEHFISLSENGYILRGWLKPKTAHTQNPDYVIDFRDAILVSFRKSILIHSSFLKNQLLRKRPRSFPTHQCAFTMRIFFCTRYHQDLWLNRMKFCNIICSTKIIEMEDNNNEAKTIEKHHLRHHNSSSFSVASSSSFSEHCGPSELGDHIARTIVRAMNVQSQYESNVYETSTLRPCDFREIRPLLFEAPNREYVLRGSSYAPLVFSFIRTSFGITSSKLKDLFSSHAVRDNSGNGGKSGSLFFQLDEFILKSVSKEEKDVLLDMLEQYSVHMLSNHDTFLSRFFGLFEVERGTETLIVVLMNNILHDPVPRTRVGSILEHPEVEFVVSNKPACDWSQVVPNNMFDTAVSPLKSFFMPYVFLKKKFTYNTQSHTHTYTVHQKYFHVLMALRYLL